MTGQITDFFSLDFKTFIQSTFVIIAVLVAAYELVGKFSTMIHRPVAWMKAKESDHALLLQTAEGLKALKEQHEESVRQSIRHDEMIKADLDKITKMFVDKEIDDWRWEILNMASAISRGTDYSKEQYDHVLRTYERYQTLLKENNMTNGQVDASMEVINDVYKEKLKNGF